MHGGPTRCCVSNLWEARQAWRDRGLGLGRLRCGVGERQGGEFSYGVARGGGGEYTVVLELR